MAKYKARTVRGPGRPPTIGTVVTLERYVSVLRSMLKEIDGKVRGCTDQEMYRFAEQAGALTAALYILENR